MCLKPGHLANSCPTTYKCRTCEGKHNTLLHKDSTESGSNVVEEARRLELSANGVRTFSGTTYTDATVRILLDCGSQMSAITSQCANQLGLKRF